MLLWLQRLFRELRQLGKYAKACERTRNSIPGTSNFQKIGLIIAFKDFSFTKGIWGSPWVGLEHFTTFFNSIYFSRLIKNTVLLSFYSLVFSFPIPIIFALLLNEVRHKKFKNTIQTVSYFPHFVSIVIVVGIMHTILSPETGVINNLLEKMGFEAIPFMQSKKWFRPLYVISGIWQSFGWSSIIYLAALSGISAELYEAAQIDGANRVQFRSGGVS